MATARQASVKVFRPTHVPKELHPVWHESAADLARTGRLLTASNRVDYDAVNRRYLQVLGASIQMGRKAAKQRLSANLPAVPEGATDVAIATPRHVPKELRPVWFAAARHASKQGKLLNANRQIDYHEVNRNYVKALGAYVDLGQRAASKKPAERQATGRAAWPFSDLTPNDLARMASAGQWDQVERAARMASRFFAGSQGRQPTE